MANAKSGSVLGLIFKPFLYVLALIFMVPWETSKWLTKRAYNGSWVRGLLAGLAGLPFTVYGAYFAANVVGWQYNFAWPLWLLAGALGAFAVGGIIWPALYIFPIRPIWTGCEKLFKANEKFAKNAVQPFFKGVIGVVRHLPASEHLWQVSEGKTASGRKWGMKALTFVLGVAGLCAGLSAGYGVYHLGLKLIPVFGAMPLFTGVFFSQVLAAIAAATALVFTTGFLWQYMFEEDSKGSGQSVVSMVYAGGFTYLAVTKIAAIAALSTVAFWAATAGVFVVMLAYAVPGLLALLQGGLIDAVLKGWKKLLEAAYDGDEARDGATEQEKTAAKDYTLYFAQVANICLAVLEGVVVYVVAKAVHVPQEVAYVVTGLAGVWAYASNPRDLIGKRSVSPIFGMTLAAAAGVASWFYAPASLLDHGFYRFAFGIGMALSTGLITYPFAYLLLRLVTKPVSGPVGRGLAAVSDKAVKAYDGIVSRVKKLQRAAFDDSTPFSGMFGHLIIIGLIAAGLYAGMPTLLPLHFAFWITVALTAAVAINVYMLLAKLSSSYGAETFSFLSGAAALMAAGHWAFGVSGGSWLSAFVVGGLAASAVGGIIAPAVYLIVRFPANFVLTPWLAPIVKAVFDGIWGVYVGFWKQFSVVFKILKAVFGPLFAIMAGIWASIAAAYARMFGRK